MYRIGGAGIGVRYRASVMLLLSQPARYSNSEHIALKVHRTFVRNGVLPDYTARSFSLKGLTRCR